MLSHNDIAQVQFGVLNAKWVCRRSACGHVFDSQRATWRYIRSMCEHTTAKTDKTLRKLRQVMRWDYFSTESGASCCRVAPSELQAMHDYIDEIVHSHADAPDTDSARS